MSNIIQKNGQNSSLTSRSSSLVYTQSECYLNFVPLLIAASLVLIVLESISQLFFHLFLFVSSWLMYTFFEYISHRFWMHSREKKNLKSMQMHMEHHKHPTQIKVSVQLKIALLIGNIIIVAFAIYLNNFFTIFAGLYSGFVLYLFMHQILHKKWSKKVFPRLLQAHIQHHLKHPDKCFGIQTGIWDRYFNTYIHSSNFSEQLISFYFNGKQCVCKKRTDKICTGCNKSLILVEY